MAQPSSLPANIDSSPDRLTLIAISALAYVTATGLHEQLGHSLACVLLGSHPTDMGAFYVNCDYTGMSDLSIRLVALAGPLVSFVLGLVCFLILHHRPPHANTAYYFVWLLGSIGWMAATGYLLFSGISGIGDFGFTRDGLLYQAAPELLWRSLLTLAGLLSYPYVVWIAVHTIDPRLRGQGRPRIRYARGMALTSYLTGTCVSIVIGLLNPLGPRLVVISAAAASLGATSGLLWMMEWLERTRPVPGPGLTFGRSWGWIVAGGLVCILYALVLGPTLHV